MSDRKLRQAVIRLAKTKPHLRSHLLPILRTAAPVGMTVIGTNYAQQIYDDNKWRVTLEVAADSAGGLFVDVASSAGPSWESWPKPTHKVVAVGTVWKPSLRGIQRLIRENNPTWRFATKFSNVWSGPGSKKGPIKDLIAEYAASMRTSKPTRSTAEIVNDLKRQYADVTSDQWAEVLRALAR